MRQPNISPSLLAADFSNLREELRRVKDAGAAMLHLDVMDGHFVPNISFGPPVIAALRPQTDLFFDTHLMIMEPARYLDAFCEAGADGITIHLEVCPDPVPLLNAIGERGKERGLCLNPDMPVERLAPFLDAVDRILVMSVFPGFGGQSFIEETYGRLETLMRMIDSRPVEVQVDGGVGPGNAGRLIALGVGNLVAGTSTFRAPDMRVAVDALRGAGAGEE